MMSGKSLIFCWKSSRVGNAISESSLIGVPSCFSGGRRMVKCTRSTLASDLSRLRQVRSPECGSPETRSTRSLSRTPSIETTARLLTEVSSPSMGDAARRARILDAEADRLLLAYDAEARRRDEDDAAVALVGHAGDERMQGR